MTTTMLSTQRKRVRSSDGLASVMALLDSDIREFGCLVTRESPKRLTVLEPLSFKSPSIARPYCCYINTVIFHVWPFVVVKPRTGPWKDTSPGNFLEWERVETLLAWDTVFVFEGQQFICGGGRVIRYRKSWWMQRDARLHASPLANK